VTAVLAGRASIQGTGVPPPGLPLRPDVNGCSCICCRSRQRRRECLEKI
jgi:hypothetical protein